MELAVFLAICIGLVQGLQNIYLTRHGLLPSAKPYNSLFEYIFFR